MGPAAYRGMLACAVIVTATETANATPDRAAVEAQVRFEEGLSRVKAGDFAAARVSFAEAYAVLRRPRILWNLALCEEKLGRIVDALGHFKEVARGPETTDADRANAQTHVAILASQTGHIDVEAPVGTTLTVDGAATSGIAPLAQPFDVVPGRHVVEAQLDQGPKLQGVEAPAGQTAHISFLPPAPPPPPVAASLAGAPAPASNDVAPPSSTPDEASGNARSRPSAASEIVTVSVVGGAAVAAVALGAYFAVQTQDDAKTVDRFKNIYMRSGCLGGAAQTMDCARGADAVKTENRDATASIALYVAGGVLAAGAVATWLFWPRNTETTPQARWVAPVLGPGLAGVSAGAKF